MKLLKILRFSKMLKILFIYFTLASKHYSFIFVWSTRLEKLRNLNGMAYTNNWPVYVKEKYSSPLSIPKVKSSEIINNGASLCYMLFNVSLNLFVAQAEADQVIERLLTYDKLACWLLRSIANASCTFGIIWMAALITDDNAATVFLTLGIFCTVLAIRCMISYLRYIIDYIYVIIDGVWILSGRTTWVVWTTSIALCWTNIPLSALASPGLLTSCIWTEKWLLPVFIMLNHWLVLSWISWASRRLVQIIASISVWIWLSARIRNERRVACGVKVLEPWVRP